MHYIMIWCMTQEEELVSSTANFIAIEDLDFLILKKVIGSDFTVQA